MKIENLLNKPLWQMTGEEFMFLSKSATSDSATRQLKEAVKAFMEFSKSVLRELSIRNRDTIVEYLADNPDVRNAAHTLKVFARPFLNNRQFDKGSKELDRLTSKFPSVLKEVNRSQSQGFKR